MKDTGGPAFPIVVDLGTEVTWDKGMTLRDYFAAKALSNIFYPAIQESIRTDEDLDCLKVAGFAYQMADAMLEARKK